MVCFRAESAAKKSSCKDIDVNFWRDKLQASVDDMLVVPDIPGGGNGAVVVDDDSPGRIDDDRCWE